MPSKNGHGAQPERVALYLRVSSEEQRERETIQIQREFLERYRELYELEVAEVYADDGVTGTVPLHERLGGRRLLEDTRDGKFQTVLVCKLDRLGRTLLVIVDAHDRLQDRAVAALLASGRREREGDRKYLLSGLVKCAYCGYGCSPCAAWSEGRRYSYYTWISNRVDTSAPPHRAPHVRAEWLEETVWADVRRFLENPGEVLERVKEQLSSEDEVAEQEARSDDLGRRLAEKRSEKDRYVKLYARGALSEEELDLYLTDLKNATANLKLLLEATDAELVERRERIETAEGIEAWLLALRERVAEVEEDTEEAYRVRHQLVRLLVAGVEAGRNPEGRVDIRITYRFGPPAEPIGAGVGFVSAGQNSKPKALA